MQKFVHMHDRIRQVIDACGPEAVHEFALEDNAVLDRSKKLAAVEFRLSITVEDADNVSLNIRWDGLAVSVPLDAMSLPALAAEVDGACREHDRFLFRELIDHAHVEALELNRLFNQYRGELNSWLEQQPHGTTQTLHAAHLVSYGTNSVGEELEFLAPEHVEYHAPSGERLDEPRPPCALIASGVTARAIVLAGVERDPF